MTKVHADFDYLDKHKVADAHSYVSCGGPTLRVDLGDEDYIILIEGDAPKATIDISLRSGIIRIYDSSRKWKVHPMNRNSQTAEIEVVHES